MDYSKSYSATWRVFRVNRDTWADGNKLSNVDSVTLSKTADGSLLESGGMKVVGDFERDYYRIVMTAEQGDEIERVDVATLLFDVSGGEIDYGVDTHDVDGFSVLYPASVTAVATGSYAPAGVDGVLYVQELLENSINAPVEIEGSFILDNHVVHEMGATVLDACWDVLNACNYVLQIDGSGIVYVRPKPSEPSLILGTVESAILQNGITYTADTSGIPNRYIVIDDDITAIAVNDSENSEVSTVNRGFYVDLIDTSPTLVNGETHVEYANRMLSEESILKEERSYNREYAPDVYPYSIIRGSINGMQGDFRVKSQSITCGNGIIVSEQSARETNLWQ